MDRRVQERRGTDQVSCEGRAVRIAFFGLPLAALLLRRDGHELVLVASCRDEALGNRRAARVFGRAFLRRPPLDRALFDALAAARPDLVVSWFWTTRLPREVLQAAPLGALGVHPSLLPRHRGPDPYFWAIDSGDPVTGVTAHRLDEDYDTGNVLASRSLPIDPTWTAWRLARALDRPSLALLRDVVGAFAGGRPPPEVPQDAAAATAAPEPDGELLGLHPADGVDACLRRVRALAPFPGAAIELGDDLLAITAAERAAAPRALEPGEIAVVDGRAVLRVRDGGLWLRRATLELDDDGVELTSDEIAALVRAGGCNRP